MDCFKALIVTVVGLSAICCSHFPLRKYFFISSAKTWKDAQLYCREKYTDLATFDSTEEVNQLNSLGTLSQTVWIGLHDDPASWKGTLGNDSISWKWSTTGQEIRSEYHNWSDGEPNNAEANELCVNMGTDAKWNEGKCWNTMGHICYTVRKSKITVKILMESTNNLSDPALDEEILQKISGTFTNQGWTHFKLQWKTPPQKIEEELP